MAEDRYGETEHGYYVQVGDVQEWRWKTGHDPQPEEPEEKPKKAAAKPAAKAKK
jgi:hypothetical protein